MVPYCSILFDCCHAEATEIKMPLVPLCFSEPYSSLCAKDETTSAVVLQRLSLWLPDRHFWCKIADLKLNHLAWLFVQTYSASDSTERNIQISKHPQAAGGQASWPLNLRYANPDLLFKLKSDYPLVIKHGNGTSPMNGGSFNRNITYFYGSFFEPAMFP